MTCSRSNNSPSDQPGQGASNAVASCKDCIEFLIDYLEGTLPAAKRAEFELHLELCPPCHRYLHQYQATITLGQAAMAEQAAKNPPPEALIKAIIAAMHGSTPKPGPDKSEGGKAGGCGCSGDC